MAEKKVRTEPVSMRREWIERGAPGQSQPLAVSRQCELAGVVRSWVYAPRREEILDELDLELLRPTRRSRNQKVCPDVLAA